MAEFAFNIAEKVLEKLGSLAYQEFTLAWGLESDLKKLQLTLSTIKAVLLDAEEKRATNHELRVWLEELKDAFYDAEDVLDELECEALRRDVVKRGSTSRKVRHFISSSNPLAFPCRMGHKIKEISERFDEIASRRAKFHYLIERLEDRRTMHMEREMTHSFVRASDVIGRDSDKETIIDRLIGKGDDKNVSVIPIVGIGGMGKTTLAKMVYNDERVGRHFQQKMWVCVSDDFDVTKLIKEIIISATRGNCNDLTTIDLLQTRLREILGEKKFLLILDDVWNDDRVKWIQLHDLLKEGATGSKILVTTRSDKVASIMGIVRPYNLEGLPHENCMSLFKKWAFEEGQAERYPNLIQMGNDIVKKCRGVPLAVRTLGGLLYSKTDERDWSFIRDNDIWKLEQKKDDILPALKLSYDQMPSPLKRCFAYCSMFPKDYVFDSDYLIQFWMAHGLIQSSNEDEELERVGMQYFKELWSRCFFQDVDDRDFFFRFKMHDLVHDLAVLVMQGELSIVNSKSQKVSQQVRHLSVSIENWFDEVQVPEFLNKLNNVRTVLFPVHDVRPSSQSFVDACITRFKYLRMLDLRESSIEVLSSSIDALKHLRYLDLSYNRKIIKLPESICKLQSLQTLKLHFCSRLEMLPDGIGNMISLRFLEITTRERRLAENGIGCLNSLRFLGVKGCGHLEYLFVGMQCLKALRTLSIFGCTSLISLPHGMKYLTALERFQIGDCENLNLELEGEDTDEDFRGLKLRMLWIRDLPKVVALPQWLLQGSTSSLQRMRIEGCRGLKELPEDMRRFSALKELKILYCPKLSKRYQREIGEDWPKIVQIPHIEITNPSGLGPVEDELFGSSDEVEDDA